MLLSLCRRRSGVVQHTDRHFIPPPQPGYAYTHRCIFQYLLRQLLSLAPSSPVQHKAVRITQLRSASCTYNVLQHTRHQLGLQAAARPPPPPPGVGLICCCRGSDYACCRRARAPILGAKLHFYCWSPVVKWLYTHPRRACTLPQLASAAAASACSPFSGSQRSAAPQAPPAVPSLAAASAGAASTRRSCPATRLHNSSTPPAAAAAAASPAAAPAHFEERSAGAVLVRGMGGVACMPQLRRGVGVNSHEQPCALQS